MSALGSHHTHWLPLALAGLLALLGVWLNQVTQPTRHTDLSDFEHEPDSFAEQLNAMAYDHAGNPTHHLQADRLVHYTDDGTTLLTQPRISLRFPNGVHTDVRARRGQISGDGAHVHFIEAVEATRHIPDGDTQRLTTSYLWVTPDAHELRTNRPVRITQPHGVIEAGALYADKHALHLSGGVRADYDNTP